MMAGLCAPTLRVKPQSGGAMPRSVLWMTAAFALYGCATMSGSAPQAVAQMKATSGNTANGTVTFSQQGSDVRMVAKLTGVPPGKHGFHIHEKGDCSAPDGMSAGGHFNPTGKPHGNPMDADHHAGDMPMLEADASGNATLDTTIGGVAIGQGAGDIVGKAVIVHKDADDFKTQPTGNSGARIACGVIGKA
jgi:superoxide dismutase, Cu-Zn family